MVRRAYTDDAAQRTGWNLPRSAVWASTRLFLFLLAMKPVSHCQLSLNILSLRIRWTFQSCPCRGLMDMEVKLYKLFWKLEMLLISDANKLNVCQGPRLC